MSLVVSMRVPDGIVVAADSLSTSFSHLQFVAKDLALACPKCKTKISAQQMRLPTVPIPFSASSYTQKLFSIFDKIAVSSFGMGILNNKSIYYHINQFVASSEKTDDLEQVKEKLILYFEKELLQQYPHYKEEAPEQWHPLGLHLNGFIQDKGRPEGLTYEIYLGKQNVIRKQKSIGCTIGGDNRVVQKLWDIGKEQAGLQFKFQLFSLQDAIDSCEFYIGTTSAFQRFANEVPTVGGEIDIALITPFQGFQWIKQKNLIAKLEGCGRSKI